MGICLTIIGLLIILLVVCFIAYKTEEAKYHSICERLSKKTDEYNGLIYDYCILANKLNLNND